MQCQKRNAERLGISEKKLESVVEGKDAEIKKLKKEAHDLKNELGRSVEGCGCRVCVAIACVEGCCCST